MDIQPGQNFAHYQKLTFLGQGAMGQVFRAHDSRLDRSVAIKILPVDFASDSGRLRRFEQEAKAVAQLNHPNIVQIFDTGTWEGVPYLVMELVEGPTLRAWMGSGPVVPRKAVAMAIQLAQGLAAAHDVGIVHRDLKPENVLIGKDGRPRILDFGLAKVFQGPTQDTITDSLNETLTLQGHIVGTVGYMAPEQLNEGRLDGRTDLFALGVLLWEMLTGSRPFRCGSAIDTLHAILRQDPPDLPSTLNVPTPLERCLRRCLEKEPANRFQSARDLAFALEQITWESTGSSGTRPPMPPLGKQLRLPLVAWTALALAGAILLGFKLPHHSGFRSERLTPSARVFSSARFLPNQKSIVYTASFGGPNAEDFGDLYRLNPGEPPLFLGIRNCRVEDVSTSGELLLTLHGSSPEGLVLGAKAVLAHMPAVPGTSPRILPDVINGISDTAVWAKGGQAAIVENFPGKVGTTFTYDGHPFFIAPEGAASAFVLNAEGTSITFPEFQGEKIFRTTVSLDGRLISRTPADGLILGLRPHKRGLVSFQLSADFKNPWKIVSIADSGAIRETPFPMDAELWDINDAGDFLITPGWDYFSGTLQWLEPSQSRERSINRVPPVGVRDLNLSVRYVHEVREVDSWRRALQNRRCGS